MHSAQEDDAWVLKLDGLSHRVEIVANSLERSVERQVDILTGELETMRQELSSVGDINGPSHFYSQVIQHSAAIAVSSSSSSAAVQADHPMPCGLQQLSPLPEPRREPEPEPVPDMDAAVALQHLLSLGDESISPQRTPKPTRPPRKPVYPIIPTCSGALDEDVTAARRRRQGRGSAEALTVEARQRRSEGVRTHAETAMYRARLAKAALNFDRPDTPEEGVPPSMPSDNADADGLLKWFRDKKLSSIAHIVCDKLGVHSVEDLSSITPAALTELASTNASNPKLNPLRVARLQNALAKQFNDDNLDWGGWCPPLASVSCRVDALESLGLSSTMRNRHVSATRQILARNALSRVEAERVAREERARLKHAQRQWCKRGETRSQTTHNAAVSASGEPRYAARHC